MTRTKVRRDPAEKIFREGAVVQFTRIMSDTAAESVRARPQSLLCSDISLFFQMATLPSSSQLVQYIRGALYAHVGGIIVKVSEFADN